MRDAFHNDHSANLKRPLISKQMARHGMQVVKLERSRARNRGVTPRIARPRASKAARIDICDLKTHHKTLLEKSRIVTLQIQ